MSNITITVDKALKRTMKELKDVNWSEVARGAFEEKIKMEKRKKAAQAIKKIGRKSKTEWSGSEEIRKWRDKTK